MSNYPYSLRNDSLNLKEYRQNELETVSYYYVTESLIFWFQDKTDDENMAALNLFITIISVYFGQTDLGDSLWKWNGKFD